MGAGITAHAMAEVFDEGNRENVAGVILESAFNNLAEEVRCLGKRKSGAVGLLLEMADEFKGIEAILEGVDIEFRSDKWLPRVSC